MTVVAVHAALLAALFHFQPTINAAPTDVVQMTLISPPQTPLTARQPAPRDSLAKPQVRKVQRTVTSRPPLETSSEIAITLPPAPPARPAPIGPTPLVASAPPAPPAPPAPTVLPRFDADYLQNPAPPYPALSRRLGEQGRVLLRVVVRPDGAPETVEVRRGSGSVRLDEAALEGVKKWRFVPARQGDTPVTAAVIVPIVFSLEG